MLSPKMGKLEVQMDVTFLIRIFSEILGYINIFELSLIIN